MRKYILALVAVGIIAALETPPMLISLTLPNFDLNLEHGPLSYPGWSGYTTFRQILEDAGYNVTVASDTEELERGLKPGCLYVVLAPDRRLDASAAESVRQGNITLLLLDETVNSNGLLEELMDITIDRELLSDEYPVAKLRAPGGTEHTLVLNRASRIIIGPTSSAEAIGRTDSGDIVAAYAHGAGWKAYVVGDSSLFLNLAYATETSEVNYTSFTRELVGRLADSEDVVFDGAIYAPRIVSPPSGTLRAGGLSIPIPWHPATIAIMLASLYRMFEAPVARFLQSMWPAALIAILLILVVIRKASPYIRRFSKADEYVEAPAQVSILAETALRRSILSRKKLGGSEAKALVISLRELLDRVLLKYKGVDLASPKAPGLVAQLAGLSVQDASAKVGRLNRVCERAKGTRRLPIIFSWSGELGRQMSFAESLLSSLGFTLMKEGRGVEYALRR